MKILFSILGLIIVFTSFCIWSEKRTEALTKAYAIYEACVFDNYGELPSSIYAKTGQLPECK